MGTVGSMCRARVSLGGLQHSAEQIHPGQRLKPQCGLIRWDPGASAETKRCQESPAHPGAPCPGGKPLTPCRGLGGIRELQKCKPSPDRLIHGLCPMPESFCCSPSAAEMQYKISWCSAGSPLPCYLGSPRQGGPRCSILCPHPCSPSTEDAKGPWPSSFCPAPLASLKFTWEKNT